MAYAFCVDRSTGYEPHSYYSVHKSSPVNRLIITSNKQVVGLLCSSTVLARLPYFFCLENRKIYGMCTGDELYFISFYNLLLNICSELIYAHERL
jgi:hypothetical protein